MRTGLACLIPLTVFLTGCAALRGAACGGPPSSPPAESPSPAPLASRAPTGLIPWTDAKPNGVHQGLAVAVDGTPARPQRFWLARSLESAPSRCCSAVRGWLRQVGPRQLTALAVLAAVIVAITLLGLGLVPVQSQDLRPLPANTSPLNRIALVGSQHRYLFLPVSGRVTAGVKYRYALTTQCGLADPVGPDFDGSFWVPVVAGLAGGGPPPGLMAPVDRGYLVLTSANLAEFHSAAGATVRFQRHQGSVIAPLCE